jgi:hypothetical protein
MQASNTRTALQAFAELLFRDQHVGNKASAEFAHDLQEIQDMVDRLMEMDRQIKPFQSSGSLPYPLIPDYSLSRHASTVDVTSKLLPLWTWHDRSPVRSFDMREFGDPMGDQATRLKQWAKDMRTLLGITWGANVNVGERKFEVTGETDFDTRKAERGLPNLLQRWLRTR